MAGIRSRDTKPELIIRRGLHRLGLRFRLHDRKLPGRPDLVFPRHRAVIRVNGCFWHGHDCPAFRLPATRRDWWTAKIDRNRQRDRETRDRLERDGWLVVDVWECEVRGKSLAEIQGLLMILEATVRHSK
jgi:DNA mismatch endonuclease, patch repair protein